MTDERKVIQAGPFKGYTVEFAPDKLVEQYAHEMYQLLLLIGEFMDPDDPKGWAEYCMVTDMSTLGDFTRDKKDVAGLSEKLGFTVERKMYLHEICALMRKQQA